MSDLLRDPLGEILGWRFDIERLDGLVAESYELAMPPETYAAPRFMDPRDWLRVEDQGQIGSCSGNARTTIEELILVLALGTSEGVEQLSRMGAYLAAQKIDGLLGRDQGATIDGQAKAAKLYGTAPERVFPYPSAYTTRVPEEYWIEAAKCKCGSTTVLRSYEQCRDFLGRGIGGILLGVPWTESLARSRGQIDESTGATYGGHALAAVGYRGEEDGGASDRQGRPYLMWANSHTKRYANGGYALVAPHLFDRSDWIKIGFSDLPNPNDSRFIQRNWWTSPFDPVGPGMWLGV